MCLVWRSSELLSSSDSWLRNGFSSVIDIWYFDCIIIWRSHYFQSRITFCCVSMYQNHISTLSRSSVSIHITQKLSWLHLRSSEEKNSTKISIIWLVQQLIWARIHITEWQEMIITQVHPILLDPQINRNRSLMKV